MLPFITVPAFPLNYAIDVGGDGSFETGETINLSPQTTATVDFYLDGYACPPDDMLFSGRAYIAIDESIVQINDCFPYDTSHGGPFDPTLSGCTHQENNVYLMIASNFNFVQVSGGRQKFGTLEIEFIENDESFDLVAATDLTAYGYPTWDDCFIPDCNLSSQLPDDGVATMIRTTIPPCLCDFNRDGRVGLADLVIMKNEFLRTDCDVNPCHADCNGDGIVDLTDLSIIKEEFTRQCLKMP